MTQEQQATSREPVSFESSLTWHEMASKTNRKACQDKQLLYGVDAWWRGRFSHIIGYNAHPIYFIYMSE